MTRRILVSLILLLSCNALFSSELTPNQRDKRASVLLHNKIRSAAHLSPIAWDRRLASEALKVGQIQSSPWSHPGVMEGNVDGVYWINRYVVCGQGGRDYPIEDAINYWNSRPERRPYLQLTYEASRFFGCAKSWGYNSLCGPSEGSHSVLTICVYMEPHK